MISNEFKKEDYWRIKWPLLAMLLSLLFAGGLFFALTTVDTAAAAELRRARSELDSAREDVEKIEEEEQTIIKNIGRYRTMEEDRVVMPEDRLQFQERLLEISSENELFLVSLEIGIQSHMPLQYSEGRTEPGKEVILNTSPVDINLSLLHENDLSRLLADLMDGPGVLQPLRCTVSANSRRTTSFIYLAQHFSTECSLLLYTFQPPPPAPQEEEE
jgi:hypothetical protein